MNVPFAFPTPTGSVPDSSKTSERDDGPPAKRQKLDEPETNAGDYMEIDSTIRPSNHERQTASENAEAMAVEGVAASTTDIRGLSKEVERSQMEVRENSSGTFLLGRTRKTP